MFRILPIVTAGPSLTRSTIVSCQSVLWLQCYKQKSLTNGDACFSSFVA